MTLRGFLKIRRPIFFLLIIAFVATFFFQSQYRFVSDIDDKLLEDPIQTEILNPQKIEFEKEGIQYSLTPLYDYEINGLIVNKAKYDAWYSINDTDTVFTTDLCMIWGSNVESGVYKSPKLAFTQDIRFCFYNWWGEDLEVDVNEVSNNHLVIDNEEIDETVQDLTEGDQIQVIGKLVNVDISEIGTTNLSSWKTSTDREDSYGGACEVIYVEKINMLKQGNPIIKMIHELSFYGIIFLILFEIVYSFIESRRILEKTDRLGRRI